MGHDVLVVGLGSAGAAAAAACAEAGLRVLALDRAPLDRAGARWINGVPGWAFDEGGWGRPEGAECVGAPGRPFHLIAGWGPERIVLRDHDVYDVDMGPLITRLQARAADAGATLRGGVAVTGREGTTLQTADGPLEARWIVDATGHRGPDLGPRAHTRREDLCTAVQEVYGLADPAAAEAWVRGHGAEPGDVLCFTGLDGGFSILNVSLHGDAVSILCGTIPADDARPARVVVDGFVSDQAWIGARRAGGARAIPIRRPATRLHDGPVLRIGDAANQVYAAHGSGIAAQLVAARWLAEALVSGGGGAAYTAAWHRRFGADVAAADVFARFSRQLDLPTFRRLLDSGLIPEDLAKAGLEQRAPEPDLAGLARIVRGLARDASAAPLLLPMVARQEAVRLLHRLHPSERWEAPWARLVERLTGVEDRPR